MSSVEKSKESLTLIGFAASTMYLTDSSVTITGGESERSKEEITTFTILMLIQSFTEGK